MGLWLFGLHLNSYCCCPLAPGLAVRSIDPIHVVYSSALTYKIPIAPLESPLFCQPPKPDVELTLMPLSLLKENGHIHTIWE